MKDENNETKTEYFAVFLVMELFMIPLMGYVGFYALLIPPLMFLMLYLTQIFISNPLENKLKSLIQEVHKDERTN